MISFGFSTLGCPGYDLDQVIAMATANGYAGVELRFLRGTVEIAALPEFSPERIGETRRRFADAGVAVVAIDTGVRMVSLDPAERERQRVDARRSLGIAEALGAPYLRLFGGPLPPEQDREATLDAVAEGLGAIAEETAARGVASLLETHDAFCRSDAVLDLYRRGMSPKLEVLWDTLHTWRHGETAEDTWRRLGERVRLVHVKDARTATPEGFDFALTGEGTVPVLGFVEFLEREGFDGFVDFEWEKGWHPEIAEPEVALPHFARFMADRRR